MIKHNQSGAVSGALVSLIVAVILLIGALAFGGWAFNSRQDYKNNVDSKIKTAVTAAKQQQTAADQKTFAEEAKNPLQTYRGPEAFGSVVINYPKTWSAFIDDTGTGAALINGYFAPGIVPATSSKNSVFALRIQVLSQSYPQTIKTFGPQERAHQLTAGAYALPKVPGNVGLEVTGKVQPGTPTETMVVVPIRSYTLEIWTQGTQYLNDFNTYILPNLSFSP